MRPMTAWTPTDPPAADDEAPDPDTARIIAMLERLPENVRGRNVPKLVAWIREALDPVDDELVFIGLTPAEAEAARAQRADAIEKLLALKEAVAAVRPLLHPAPSALDLTPRPDEPAAGEQPARGRRLSFNPFVGAVRFLSGRREPRHVAIARAAAVLRDELEHLRVPEQSKDVGGRPPKHGPGYGLVRAVCAYRAAEGMPVSLTWKSPRTVGRGRRQPDEPARQRGGATTKLLDAGLPTDSHTTELIVQAAKAFGVDASHSDLRGFLHKYRDDLKRLGRGPDDSDFAYRI